MYRTIPDVNEAPSVFCILSGLQGAFLGAWFDLQYSKDLK